MNLSFVKDINTVGKQMARNGPTAAIYKFSFISEQSIEDVDGVGSTRLQKWLALVIACRKGLSLSVVEKLSKR